MELGNEVRQKDILKYFDEKYGTKDIYTLRRIRDWISDAGIECIHPIPKKHADRRYYKEDVIMLERMYMDRLIKRAREQKLARHELGSDKLKIKTAQEYKQRKQDMWDNQQNNLSTHEELANTYEKNISEQADEIIRTKMLEMCFSKLYPNVEFDKEKLKQQLWIVEGGTIASDVEKGAAIEYIETGLFVNY